MNITLHVYAINYGFYVMQHIVSVESSSLLLHSYLTSYTVDREDSLTS